MIKHCKCNQEKTDNKFCDHCGKVRKECRCDKIRKSQRITKN